MADFTPFLDTTSELILTFLFHLGSSSLWNYPLSDCHVSHRIPKILHLGRINFHRICFLSSICHWWRIAPSLSSKEQHSAKDRFVTWSLRAIFCQDVWIVEFSFFAWRSFMSGSYISPFWFVLVPTVIEVIRMASGQILSQNLRSIYSTQDNAA